MKAAASLAKDLLKIMNARNSKKPSPYDTEAEVKRIDGETAWVEIPGSNDLTPVKKTINASVGDKVKVRVSGGKAWIAGNTTAPPTDNRVADVAVDMARGAGDVAMIARKAADAAEAEAQRAKEITDQLNIDVEDVVKGLAFAQNIVGTVNWIATHSTTATETTPVTGRIYYIHNQDGTYTIVEDPTGKNPAQEGWIYLDESIQNYISSHLVLLNDGLYVIKDGQSFKNRLSANGMDVMDSNNVSNAKFGAQTRIGKESGESKMLLDSKSLKMVDKDDVSYLYVSDLTDSDGLYHVEMTHTQVSEASSSYANYIYYGYILDLATSDLQIVIDDDLTIKCSDIVYDSGAYTDGSGTGHRFVHFTKSGEFYYAQTTDTIIVNYTIEGVDYTATVQGDGTLNVKYAPYSRNDPSATVNSVYFNGDQVYKVTFRNNMVRVPLLQAPIGSVIDVTFTVSGEAKAYTFGNRLADSQVGSFSYSLGRDNVASRANAIAIGVGLISNGTNMIALGKYNWVATDTYNSQLFSFGIGSDDEHRKNALVVYSDGEVYIHVSYAQVFEDMHIGYGWGETTETINLSAALKDFVDKRLLYRAYVRIKTNINSRAGSSIWYCSRNIARAIMDYLDNYMGESYIHYGNICHINVVESYGTSLVGPVLACHYGDMHEWCLWSTSSGVFDGLVEVIYTLNTQWIKYDTNSTTPIEI